MFLDRNEQLTEQITKLRLARDEAKEKLTAAAVLNFLHVAAEVSGRTFAEMCTVFLEPDEPDLDLDLDAM